MRRKMMTTGIVMAFLASAVAAEADADRLTCDAFKQQLENRIHSEGDEVATPKDYYVLKKDELPRILYGFGGIVGIKGDLNCAPDDGFRQFSFKVDTRAETDAAATRIVIRSTALLSAALCAAKVADDAACRDKAADMIGQSIHAMKLAADRGEPLPHGEAETEREDVAEARVSALPDELAIEVIADQ